MPNKKDYNDFPILVESAPGETSQPIESSTAPTLTTPKDNTGLLSVPGNPSRGTSRSPSDDGETLVPPESPRETHLEDAEDPLRPDPGNEHEFEVEDNRFAFSPGQLGKLINPKSLHALHALGGIEGLEKGLRTDLKAGLSLDETTLDGQVTFEQATGSGDRRIGNSFKPTAPARAETSATQTTAGKPHNNSFKDRLRVFKDNRLPEKESKSLLHLMWIEFMDKALLLLSVAAVISLALGLYQTFGAVQRAESGPKIDWVKGVAIIVAIVIVVVGAGNDYQKELQFVKLNKKEDRTAKVIRSGKSIQISVYDLMVGDLCRLEPGDLIPADGILISGENVKCVESSPTGKSDQMKKIAAYDAFVQMEAGSIGIHKLDAFIISGSKVLEGVGTFLVTSVGVHSSFGKTMMALREESTATPLQMKPNDFAEAIARLGGRTAPLLLFLVFIRFLVSRKGQHFMQILITAITVVLVTVQQGLLLALKLAVAFATIQILRNLARVLQSCETMGNATTICSDKTDSSLTTDPKCEVFLTVVYKPPADEQPDVDIIFVHGLNPVNHENHAKTTWSHTNGKFWPEDFLPQSTPRSRILIFGYNSNVAFNVSQKGFRHHADRLLECLSISRREAEANNRPIIFIGHSLGGLIIKQALVTANNNHRKYGDIRHSTKGLVFFGTPHRGGNGAKFGNRVTNVVADMTGIESNDLLTYLDRGSPLAQNVHEDFSHQLPDYRCVSFFETLPTKLPFFPLQKIIVDSDSAQLGASLVNEKVIGLDFDHRNMCKLGAADENYFKVVGPIMELVKHCQEEAAIHSLAVKAPTFWQRLENLVSPTPHHMPCVSCKRYHCGRTGCI